MPRTPLTQEALYEYRMKYIIRKVLNELGLKPENLNGDELSQALFERPEILGIAVLQDMFAWMEEDSWLELVKGG